MQSAIGTAGGVTKLGIDPGMPGPKGTTPTVGFRALRPQTCVEKSILVAQCRWPGSHTVCLGHGSIFRQRYPGLAQVTSSSIVRARADVECLPAKHYPNKSQVCSDWPALSKDPCERMHS